MHQCFHQRRQLVPELSLSFHQIPPLYRVGFGGLEISFDPIRQFFKKMAISQIIFVPDQLKIFYQSMVYLLFWSAAEIKVTVCFKAGTVCPELWGNWSRRSA